MSTQELRNQVNELWAQAKKNRAKDRWQDAVNSYSRILKLATRFVPSYVERGLLVQEMGYPDMAWEILKTPFRLTRNMDMHTTDAPG
jgi:hypothetical protein